jgi:hypothetical protein
VAYCTTTDVTLETGTSLGTITLVDVGNMITKSDKEIVSFLKREYGITSPPAADDDLQTASVQLTIAKIKRRQAHELSRPNALTLVGDISFSTSPEAEAQAAEKKAFDAIALYAAEAGGDAMQIVPNADDPYLDLREA